MKQKIKFDELESLKNISFKLAKSKEIIQGAGGNTSLKTKNTIWIKASGMKLIDSKKKDIFIPVDLQKAKDKIFSHHNNDEIIYTSKSNLIHRASIETGMHLLIDYKYVLHTHPIDVILNSVKKGSRKFFNEILKGYKWIWIEYTKPGIQLTLKIHQELKKNKKANILILENHGLVVAGDDIEETYKLHQEILSKLKINNINKFKISTSPLSRIVNDHKNNGFNFRAPLNKSTNLLAFLNNIKELIFNPLFPDQVMFCNPANIIFVDNLKEYDFKLINDKTLAIVFKDKGVIISEKSDLSMEEILEFLVKVALKVENLKELKFLTNEECYAISHSDLEIYRTKLNTNIF